MIFDNVLNKELYYGCHKGFKIGFDFIARVIEEGIEPGKYELDGKNVYASVQEYTTKDDTEKFEGHKNYIDIQYIISGQETMEYSNIAECEAITSYNSEKDVEFFVSNGFKTRMECTADSFAIFFPNDIHKPGIKLDANSPVKKVVVKVHI